MSIFERINETLIDIIDSIGANSYLKEDFKVEDLLNIKFKEINTKNNQVLGYIMIGKIREGENPGYKYRKQLDIEALIVDEKARGKGIRKNSIILNTFYS